MIKRIIFLIFCFAFTSSIFANGYIGFAKSNTAKEIVYLAYQKIYRINELILSMQGLAVDASDYMISDEKRQQLNERFQQQLQAFDELKLKPSNHLFLSINNPITISLPEKTYFFDLSDVAKLSAQLDMATAKQTLSILTELLKKIEQSSTATHPFTNQLIVKDGMDKLASTAESIQQFLIGKLTLMRNLARYYIERNGAEDMQMAYWQAYFDFTSKLQELDVLSTSNMFSNSSISFTYRGRNYHYRFPKIELRDYDLSGINIKTVNNAKTAMQMLGKMKLFISDWTLQ